MQVALDDTVKEHDDKAPTSVLNVHVFYIQKHIFFFNGAIFWQAQTLNIIIVNLKILLSKWFCSLSKKVQNILLQIIRH